MCGRSFAYFFPLAGSYAYDRATHFFSCSLRLVP
jgi:hypothetical protein